MKKINVGAGTHISNLAKKMVASFASDNQPVQGEFNGIILVADQNSTVESIQKDYSDQSDAQVEAYRNSPEGQKDAREREERIQCLMAQRDALMTELSTLDFSSNVAVLDWLCAMQDPSDHVDVSVDKQVILSTFAQHGLVPNMNTGSAYNGEDEDNSAKYVIGQGLSTLEFCSIHHMVNDFAEEWKKKFGKMAA